jgi:hypothetical protein
MMAKADGTGARPKSQKKIGVSAAEAARQLGITRQAIYAWSKAGWLVRHPDRSVDLEATRARVDAYRHPTVGGKPDRDLGPAPSYSDPADTPDEPDPDGDGEDYKAARTRRERAAADKAELEAARMRGELVPLADATAAYTSEIVRARAELEALPIRVAPKLVGQTEERAIRDILRTEINRLLQGLSDAPGL